MQKRCGTGIKNSIETEWTRNDLRARRRPESIPQRGPCRVDAELESKTASKRNGPGMIYGREDDRKAFPKGVHAE